MGDKLAGLGAIGDADSPRFEHVDVHLVLAGPKPPTGLKPRLFVGCRPQRWCGQVLLATSPSRNRNVRSAASYGRSQALEIRFPLGHQSGRMGAEPGPLRHARDEPRHMRLTPATDARCPRTNFGGGRQRSNIELRPKNGESVRGL
jgi:hypothetical protein